MKSKVPRVGKPDRVLPSLLKKRDGSKGDERLQEEPERVQRYPHRVPQPGEHGEVDLVNVEHVERVAEKLDERVDGREVEHGGQRLHARLAVDEDGEKEEPAKGLDERDDRAAASPAQGCVKGFEELKNGVHLHLPAHVAPAVFQCTCKSREGGWEDMTLHLDADHF